MLAMRMARCSRAILLALIFMVRDLDERFNFDYVLIGRLHSHRSYKLADSSEDPDIHLSEPPEPPKDYRIGYGNPPRHAQFRKGVSGCPTGRPKRPEGISIKEILDGDQRAKMVR